MDAATIVRRVRALGGVTRRELADLADVSPSTIGRIEQGTLDPTWGMLWRILEATGNRISGDTVVSAGDSTAIAAARAVLEPLLAVPAAQQARLSSEQPTPAAAPWLDRWARAGWLADPLDADDVVSIAVAAGNAGKIARRAVVRRSVAAPGGWRAVARQLEESGLVYAVSGLVAARLDRATASSASPMIYVENPSLVVASLDLEETALGRGVLLIAPGADELLRTEVDDGIRFVPRTQGLLDAFAGVGREPDKAEDALRSLVAVAA